MNARYCQPPVDRATRPRTPPPRGSCECHSHVFGPADRFPFTEDRSYTPPDAPVERYLALLDQLGLERGILVQGSAHGTDNAALLDALKKAPERLRGVVVVDEDVPTKTLAAWCEAGVRGARFNHLLRGGRTAFKGGVGIDSFFAQHDRLADLGWHLQLWCDCKDLPDLWPRLKDVRVPIVIDHMGRIDAHQGLAYPGFDFMRGLLAEGRVWMKLSGAYRGTDTWPDYPEARPFHEALVAANPKQCLWGLDWPHPSLKATMPDDSALLDLFMEWTPEAETRRRILVHNPARLYGFPAMKEETR